MDHQGLGAPIDKAEHARILHRTKGIARRELVSQIETMRRNFDAPIEGLINLALSQQRADKQAQASHVRALLVRGGELGAMGNAPRARRVLEKALKLAISIT